MPNTDELRDLIRQVEAKGGPLRLGDHYPWIYDSDDPIASLREACETPTDQDMLTGILRRDMLKRGCYTVSHLMQHGFPWHHEVAWVAHRGSFDTEVAGDAQADGVLEAHLRAWLDAAEKLGWRKVPPRDDLYDGRMPLDELDDA